MFGCWDLLHKGHIYALQYAKEHCDYLIVGVYSDEVIKQYKRETPIITERGRARTVYNLNCVDAIKIIVDRPSLLDFSNIDRLFISTEWQRKSPPFIPKSFHGDIIYVPYTVGISTSLIKKRITQSSKKYMKRLRENRKRGKTD